MAETETLASRDRDVGLTSRDKTLKFQDETFAGLETWPRRWNARCH